MLYGVICNLAKILDDCKVHIFIAGRINCKAVNAIALDACFRNTTNKYYSSKRVG
jgi:hypothetical protein